jgi:hypothetical protein
MNDCPACGAAAGILWVHGHGQCPACGTVIVPCCMGAGDEADEASGDAEIAAEDVVAAFHEISGGAAMAAATAVVHSLVQRFGCGWQAADAAVDLAARLRLLVREGALVRLA